MTAFRIAAGAFLLSLSALAGAQTYPAKSVRIVVPYAPGGAVDAVTRKIAQKLTEQTGQTFYVENKAGATGTIGASEVARSAPDGYTLMANDSTYSLLPHIFKKLPFDHRADLVPVSTFMTAPMALVVSQDSKYKTLQDLLAAARANKGGLTYGTGGAGTTPHFSSEALGIAADVKFLHVPFKGAGEATLALLSGTIDFQMASTPGVIGQVKGGKARLLAISGDKRVPSLADTPTFAEAGLKNFSVIQFSGLWAPKGTPAPVMERLQKEVAAAVASADFKAYADGLGAQPNSAGTEVFARMLNDSTTYWGKVAAHSSFEKE
ncbi:MAG: Bug family tripartite tricarboxylate transporter substrate binding protein [Aquincola tertiaricarbonis]|uniref:Bug family tripartite tricarboxylate transporter substrate binding protein n=1 Tax=Aquincola TaxID=391952 RepID=UPI000614F590|nr:MULTISPECIES: tripartite tricarboxylate transporter substrate binding protein [Aquincola]MCR5867142.1 tripartite tricarboxylate transporter substrate binding protein [Aquincola sp. J276]